MHACLDRFDPTKHRHVRDHRQPDVAARLAQPRQRNRRPDCRMNKRAIRGLARLARRYENGSAIPLLKDVETELWHAGAVADRRLGGYWLWGPVPLLPSDIEHWTSQHLGWSFPCAEAVEFIRRFIRSPCGRVIDIGTRRGLWTKVFKRAVGSDKVVGRIRRPGATTCSERPSPIGATKPAAPRPPTFCVHHGCLVKTRTASNWEIRYSTASSWKIRPSFTWDPVPVVPPAPRTSMTV